MHTSKWSDNALKILQYFGAFASVWDIMHERVKFLKVEDLRKIHVTQLANPCPETTVNTVNNALFIIPVSYG